MYIFSQRKVLYIDITMVFVQFSDFSQENPILTIHIPDRETQEWPNNVFRLIDRRVSLRGKRDGVIGNISRRESGN